MISSTCGEPVTQSALPVSSERYRADLEAAERALPAVRRKLAATVGVPDQSAGPLAGSMDASPPRYESLPRPA